MKMNSTGITREVDQLGRIVIPKEIRDNLKIKSGEKVEIFKSGNMVGIRKFEIDCFACGAKDNLIDLDSKKICKKCVNKLKKIMEW